MDQGARSQAIPHKRVSPCGSAHNPDAQTSSTPQAPAPNTARRENTTAAHDTNAATATTTPAYANDGNPLSKQAQSPAGAANNPSTPATIGTSDTPTTEPHTPDPNTHTATPQQEDEQHTPPPNPNRQAPQGGHPEPHPARYRRGGGFCCVRVWGLFLVVILGGV